MKIPIDNNNFNKQIYFIFALQVSVILSLKF